MSDFEAALESNENEKSSKLKPGGPRGYEEIEDSGGPEFSRGDTINTTKSLDENKPRRGSHGLRSILLKGEMRYLKDVNMLVFLCSPL